MRKSDVRGITAEFLSGASNIRPRCDYCDAYSDIRPTEMTNYCARCYLKKVLQLEIRQERMGSNWQEEG